jgi:hypothetical protein
VGRLKKEPAKTSKQRQSEDEADHELEQEYLKSHHEPRCLKWGERRGPLEERIRRVEKDCQAIGRDVRFIHHREGLYLLQSLSDGK